MQTIPNDRTVHIQWHGGLGGQLRDGVVVGRRGGDRGLERRRPNSVTAAALPPQSGPARAQESAARCDRAGKSFSDFLGVG